MALFYLSWFSCVLVFFFSSSRLLTKCYRDWSSDVCSSDLSSARTASWTRCGFTSAPKTAASSVRSFDFLPFASSTGALGTAMRPVLPDLEQPLAGAGDGALHEQQVVLDVDRVDDEADLRAALRAHVAGHADALHDSRRRRRGADGARLADVVRAVRHRAALEVVPLDRSLEALADRDAAHLHLVARLERLDGDVLADDRVARASELDEMAVRTGAVRLQMADLALRELPLRDGLERELHGLVTVGVGRAHEDDRARPRLDHGHGRDAAGLLVEDLRHADLAAENPLHQSLISMSTPAGRSRRMSESTVFGVGEWMSISRLCVRISKCSRESLSLNGERITV